MFAYPTPDTTSAFGSTALELRCDPRPTEEGLAADNDGAKTDISGDGSVCILGTLGRFRRVDVGVPSGLRDDASVELSRNESSVVSVVWVIVGGAETEPSCGCSIGEARVDARLPGRLVDFLLPLSRLSLSVVRSLINGEGLGSRKNRERRKASGCCCAAACAALARLPDPLCMGGALILDLCVGNPNTVLRICRQSKEFSYRDDKEPAMYE